MEEPSDDTPSVSLSLDSSLREGAGNGYGGLYHSTRYSLNRKGTGDFHRPYETQNGLHFTIHRRTLPQSRIRSTAPSGREPGTGTGAGTIQPGTRETGRVRAIFIAPTKLRMGYISPFNLPLGNRGGGGRFSSPERRFPFIEGGTHQNYSWVVSISLTVLAISKKGA